MPTKIQAIECPKCGNTHKTVLRPGDFRCDSCGTEYFIDDGTVKFGQRPVDPAAEKRATSLKGCALWCIGLLVAASMASMAYFAWENATRADRGAKIVKDFTWSVGFANDLYIAADNRPVLITLGTKEYYGHEKPNTDYIAFNDVRDNSVIAMLPLSDASLIHNNGLHTNFDVQEYANGDIYIIVEKSQLLRVRKTAYAFDDVSESLFEGLPELAKGVANIELIDNNHARGFRLTTNDGTKLFFDPLTRKVYSKQASSNGKREQRSSESVEKTGFAFSLIYNADFPQDPSQLITFRYLVDPNLQTVPVFPYYGSSQADRWDAKPEVLEELGIVSHGDFTPGKVYFDYGVLYFDTDYVLISYRPTPRKNAPRYVELLDAKTAAVIFSTPLDVHYAPTECVRYKDGFAILSDYDTYTLSLSGKLEKRTPVMYVHQ